MPRPDEERDPLESIAADFLERRRRGEFPSLSEYKTKYPDLAEELEELLPAVAALESLKTHKEESSGAHISMGAPRLERLGDFRILGEIGRGGMAIVYEAYQESLGRHVAVKVLPKQSLLDSKQLRRFKREAQTAARLHHTNIVPVFGVGEQEGYHYIVMQLIRGVGLDVVLRQLRRKEDGPSFFDEDHERSLSADASSSAIQLAEMLLQGEFRQTRESDRGADVSSRSESSSDFVGYETPPSRTSDELAATEVMEITPNEQAPEESALTSNRGAQNVANPQSGGVVFGASYWRSAAAIGLQAAEALGYAHAHHTLHRDVKPANMLLDSLGTVWIADFGLAKAMEQGDGTETAGIAGTLRYIAPEQFSGKTDARSDIYSLGLTLYELLTLRPAFEDSSRGNLIRKITHEEPMRPRKVRPDIPRDLETIALKAIARDPVCRYQTAGELADDLQRFLEDRPILARRASPVERLWRWARRNRLVAGLSACVLVLLVAVAATASVGYVHTMQANKNEAAQRQKAEQTSKLALDALDDIFRQFAPDRAPVASSMAVTDASGKEITVTTQPTLSKETAALLEHMLAFYDRLAAQGGDDVIVNQKAADANRRIGDIRYRLGQYDEAKTAYLRAIDLFKSIEASGKDDENDDVCVEIARTQNELGSVYAKMNEQASQRKSHQDALATLASADSQYAETPSYRYELARTYYYMGKSPLPPLIAFADRRGPGHNGGLGPMRGPEFDRGPDADRGPDQDPGPDEERFDNGPPFDAPPLPESRGGRRGATRGAERAQHEEYLKKAIEILNRLAESNPKTAEYRFLLARCYREAYFGRPNSPDADLNRENMDKAIRLLKTLVEEHPDVSDYRFELGEAYATADFRHPFSRRDEEMQTKDKARDDKSELRIRRNLEKASSILESLVAENPNVPDYAVSEAFAHLRMSRELIETDPKESAALLRKALDLQSSLARRYPTTYPYQLMSAFTQRELAELLRGEKRYAESRELLEASIVAIKKVLKEDAKGGPMRGVLADVYYSLADVLLDMGEKKASLTAEQNAIDAAADADAFPD